MKKEISNEAKSLIVLLGNINDLITISSNRKDAVDVMKAFRIYAKEKGFNLSQAKIDNFFSIVLDSRPNTIKALLQDLSNDVLSSDIRKNS